MEGEVGAQVSPPLFLHQGLPLGFHEAASLARKRDSAWPGSSFHLEQQPQPNQTRISSSDYSNPNWNPKSWDWDSTGFVAKPVSGASEGVQKTNGEKGWNGLDERREDLSLKLGGGAYKTVEEPVVRPNKRVRSGSPGNGGNYPMCQVDDCRADLSNAKDYHRRHKVCEVHSKTTKAVVGKQMQRFCQQCSRFHPLTEFDEGKRSCRRRLAGHNRRRRKTQAEDSSSRPVPPANEGGIENLNIVNLLAILASLQGHGVDKLSSSSLPDKDRLIQVLGKMNSLPKLTFSTKLLEPGGMDLNVSQTDGNFSALPTMDLVTAPSLALKCPGPSTIAALSGESSESSGDGKAKVHSQEPVVDANSKTRSLAFPPVSVGRSDCALPSSTEISEHPVLENNPSLCLQLFSSNEDASSPEKRSCSTYQPLEGSKPMGNKSPSSPALWRLFPLQSEAETLKHERTSVSRDDNGMFEASTSRGWVSPIELSKNFERRVKNQTVKNTPYHVGYTSSSGSDNSPSSSNSDSQERSGRIVFKLFDKDPSNFPGALRTQILTWLSHSPSDMESYIRPGCVVLSVYLSMPSVAWDELQEDLVLRVSLLVQHINSDFWRNGRFMIRMDGQLASHKDGKIRVCKTWKTTRAPEIVCVSPLAVVSGKETSLVLRGRNLNVPGTKIHCAYMGGYTSKEVPLSSYPCTIYDDSSIESFNFPGGAPNVFGRCFLEVENGFKGNSFPVIIADDAICQELRLLESEFENDLRTSDIMQEDQAYDCRRPTSKEDALHFLNELGWLFQRKGIKSCPLLESFSSTRFKFLIIFSVERDWPALVRKLLDILVAENSGTVGLIPEYVETLSEIQLLHTAVQRKYRKMVDLLLHYSISGVDSSMVYLFPPNLVGPGGVTPLHLAASMQDSEDIVDCLTDDPQEIGLSCWSSLVDDDGQSPFSYALMRNNHSYNGLVAMKLAARRNCQVSITVDNEEIALKPSLSSELNKRNFHSLETICSHCAALERRRIKSTFRPQGFLQHSYVNPILAIAAVCVCVCLFLRGAPELGSVAPFMWERLDFGMM